MTSSSSSSFTSSAIIIGNPIIDQSPISSSSHSFSYDDTEILDGPQHHGFTILPNTITTTTTTINRTLSSNYKVFINSLLCFIGSGVLGLPHAFGEVGMISGIIILWSIALISLHCMLLVVDCQTYLRDNESKHAVTYGDIGYYAFGNIGSKIVDICIILTQTGFGVAYLIFVSHNVYDVINNNNNNDTTTTTYHISRGAILSITIIPLIMLSWLRHLKLLAPFSLIAESAIMFALLVVFVCDIQYIINNSDYDPPLNNLSNPTTTTTTTNNITWTMNITRLPYFFGISVYCYEGVGMVIPIKNSMANPSSFKSIWVTAMLLVTTIYCAFGALGLLAFGNSVDSIITRSLPYDSIASTLVQISLSIGLYLTYPLMLFPVYELFDTFFDSHLRSRLPNLSETCFHLITRYIFRFIYVLFTALLAAYIPNFGTFISLVGASASAALAFILPAAFHLKLRGKVLSKWKHAREWVCILVGVLGGIIATIGAFKDAMGAFKGGGGDVDSHE